jgi:hypothetical protein
LIFIGINDIKNFFLCQINRISICEVKLMFHRVKVFDSRGQLKKVVSSKQLSNRFWRMNDNLPSYYEDNSVKSDDWNSKEKTQIKKVSMEESL